MVGVERTSLLRRLIDQSALELVAVSSDDATAASLPPPSLPPPLTIQLAVFNCELSSTYLFGLLWCSTASHPSA